MNTNVIEQMAMDIMEKINSMYRKPKEWHDVREFVVEKLVNAYDEGRSDGIDDCQSI
jgi:hypothetical protein